MNTLRDAALSYAGRGWHVFPCVWIEAGDCTCKDPECESPGKHPLTPHGLLDATNDPERVRDFWTKFPKANIAIATGAKSGIVAVDVDDIKSAKPELNKLLPGYDFKSVPMQKTGKGWHLIFSHPGEHVKTGTKFSPGMDSRGDGGYIMAAPSGHISGNQYQWKVSPNGKIPPLPAALLTAINGPSSNGNDETKPRFDASVVWEGIPEGQRDENLFKFACKLRSVDTPRDWADRLICEVAARCKPPFSEREALKKVENAYKYQTGQKPDKSEKESTGDRKHFSLIQAKELLASEEPDTEWLWEGILPAGGLSLLVAKPKVGKTTLAFNLSLAVAGGRDFLGKQTKQMPVVYLALEEKRSEIRKKLKALPDMPEGISFYFGSAPEKAIEEVRTVVRETKAGLLVVDVLQKLCRVRDLNDYAIVTNTLEPLMTTAREENCHILLTHHAGKADRPDGDDILGSTALLGGVDTSIHIRKREQRRTFSTIQRYGEDTPETVIQLNGDGSLEAVGSRQEVEIEETIPLVMAAVGESLLTEKEIWEQVEKNHNITARAIRTLVERGEFGRAGKGKSGDPYRYGKKSLFLSSVPNGESERDIGREDKLLESNGKVSLNDFDLFSLKRKSWGETFSTPESGDFLAPDPENVDAEWARINAEYAARKEPKQ